MKKTTLQSIAEQCGCSITTVSRVLNGNAQKYRISRRTAEAVMAEVTRQGYIPSYTAQSLRNKRSGMIGLLLPSIANPYFADMASHIVTELYKSDYTAILVDTMEDAARLNMVHFRYRQMASPLHPSRTCNGMRRPPCRP